MNIVEQAEKDLAFTLEDSTNGFGIEIVLIAPDNTEYGNNGELIGQTTDIGFSIDPQTGQLLIGRTAEINFRLSTILSVLGSLPKRGWKAKMTNQFTDNAETLFTLREGPVVDRKLGIFKMFLNIVEVE